MESDQIEFVVMGNPVPQGSTKSFYLPKAKRVVTTHSNPNTTRWRERIATEAQNAQQSHPFFENDHNLVYHISMEFAFEKPKSVPKRLFFHAKRPDLDKLVRAVLDGITDVLIPDDCRVVGFSAVKHYTINDEPPNVRISVRKSLNVR